MHDTECIEFLQYILPRLGYRWRGFRKVRKQVCKRIQRRIDELLLWGVDEYVEHLKENRDEWKVLDSFCYITVSRFFRDKFVYKAIEEEIFSTSTQKRDSVKCWSIGCCSGEEPYSLSIIWNFINKPKLETNIAFKVIATEREKHLIKRAQKAEYSFGCMKYIPKEVIGKSFIEIENGFRLNDELKENVEFIHQDIRNDAPDDEFDLIMCRNLAFTYFEKDMQKKILKRIIGCLKNDGFLLIGSHEKLPAEIPDLKPYKNFKCIFRKVSSNE